MICFHTHHAIPVEGVYLDKFGFTLREEDAAGLPSTRGTLESLQAIRGIEKVKACNVSALRLKRLLRDAGRMRHVELGSFICALAMAGFEIRPKYCSRDCRVNVSTRSIRELEELRDRRYRGGSR
jgi:hypothetical protein